MERSENELNRIKDDVSQSISKNKLRTLLSGGTVIFAIMLFAILFGLANGLQNTFNEGNPILRL